MQGKQVMNAGSSGKFHYSNRINPNTRYTNPNRDWRLSQMLDDWETLQEMRKKEEAMKEKAKERKEFTKDIAKLIKDSKKKRKKRTNTSSESSTSISLCLSNSISHISSISFCHLYYLINYF